MPKKNKKKFIFPKKTAEEIKKEKEKRRLRKARIILRNLSYKTTEQKLKDEFAKYGEIKEANLLKRADGKLVGCAFIQYDKVNHAAKAIHHANSKEFLGRPVVIDWAVNQKKFIQHLKQTQQNQKTDSADNNNDVSIKTESDEDSANEVNSDDGDSENAASQNENSDGEAVEEQSGEDGSSEGESEMDDEDSEEDEVASVDKEDTKDNIKIDPDAAETKPKHKLSNDIAEGCTVFIKNIPFEATNDDLRKVCRQFGPLYYALITTDKVSGHSKGNGFVKFKVI